MYNFYLERIKYLGMTVVGESDGGIIVGSIMKGYLINSIIILRKRNIFFVYVEVLLMLMDVFSRVI